MKTILTVIGTRPEAIKLAPVLLEINKSKRLKGKVCVTRQHTDLLDPFLANFGINTDFHFERDASHDSLHLSAAHILKQFGEVFKVFKPDLVVVQGDTTSAFIAALAAFYSCFPIAHVEAGLRTGHLFSPWPEEAHRDLIDRLSTYYFAPTHQAKDRLISEGIRSDKVWVVGNTSIDSLRLARKPQKSISSQRMVLITVHRRENQGLPLKNICRALLQLADSHPDVRFVFVLHPNPAVRNHAEEMLSGIANLNLLEPVDHASFIQLLDESLFVITDSGGIQEEAPFMGKPVVIIRNTTERPEGVEAGTARLVGSESHSIIACCEELLKNPQLLLRMSKTHSPYGDGYAAKRIVDILEEELT